MRRSAPAAAAPRRAAKHGLPTIITTTITGGGVTIIITITGGITTTIDRSDLLDLVSRPGCGQTAAAGSFLRQSAIASH
jgi:hypothetical protein